MQPQQSVNNTVARRGSSSEFNRWRDAGVDPELLTATVSEPVASTAQERLAPHVAEWDATLHYRDLVHTVVSLELTTGEA